MTTKPLTPKEAHAAHEANIPDEIINIVNTRLKVAAGKQCVIYQDDVVKAGVKAGLDRQQIFDDGWLNFESYYGQYGWTVRYDKPGFNESGRAHWEFIPIE
ncbi:hypothetical protein HY312_00805 [Candidatus Saccharibacteria bacterium]|nr:hypothetical protein [Candidatus Saccharibacteria bacterium]